MEDKEAYIRGMVRRQYRGKLLRGLPFPSVGILLWGAGCIFALLDDKFVRDFGPFYGWFGLTGAKLVIFGLYLLLLVISVLWLLDNCRQVLRQARSYENQLRQEAGLERR